MKEVILYTDGACSGNPGPGGWGAILIYREKRLELSGFDPHTTNNRMELTAPIEALTRLKEPCHVDVYSDSAYLINCFRQNWMDSWIQHNWMNSSKKPVENRDLWEKLHALTLQHEIVWHKVRGHANDELNNRCDALATGEIKRRNECK